MPEVSSRGGKSPSPPLAPFLKPLGIVLGGMSAILLSLGLAGLAWEPAAMAATLFAIAAGIVLIFTGRIWMVVAAWKDKTSLGLLSLLVPIYAYYYAFTRKGSALRGFAVLLSGFAPLLLSMILLVVYMPMYSPTARRAAARSDRQSRIADLLRQAEQRVDPDSPVRESTFRLIIRRNVDRLASDGEQAVADCEHFVHGSIKVDPVAGTVSFRHRGGDALADQYRLLIMMATETILSPHLAQQVEAVGE